MTDVLSAKVITGKMRTEALAIRTPSDSEVEKLAWTAVQSAAEWDDRTSPDGYEEYLFFTLDELHQILVSFFDTATGGEKE